MEIQQLYYYMELCRQKNFTEAGYSCNMTQGALSKQIRKLENELGTTLIRRNTRRFELSKEGEIFLSYAKEMTSMYEEMLKNIQKNKKYVIIFLAIYKSKGRCEKMNFNEEEQKLLSEANVLVETNKTYTDDEVKGFSNKIVEHIMTFSKTDIPKVKSKFDPILFKIS